MTNAPMASDRSSVSDTTKQAVLHEIGTKRSKFSKQGLSVLESNDDVVTQVVAKYGIEKIAARREVDALMKGRSI